jgi:hypothetical protein
MKNKEPEFIIPVTTFGPDSSLIFALFNYELQIASMAFIERSKDMNKLYFHKLNTGDFPIVEFQEIYNRDKEHWRVNHLYMFEDHKDVNLSTKICAFYMYCDNIKSAVMVNDEDRITKKIKDFRRINYIEVANLNKDNIINNFDTNNFMISDDILLNKNLFLTYNHRPQFY